MSTENKQQQVKNELNAQLQKQIFELGRQTYVYEATRRVAIDAIATTANAIAEATKALEDTINAAAAPQTAQQTAPDAPASDAAASKPPEAT